MMDKAGAEIAVGCRVAEADFSFGDGVVESIEVPINGGGFNVGVKWDEPERGGPTWSAQGGGRGAEHLLVLEPPPQFAGATQLPAKEYSTFQCRFGRSPTPSEAELGEEDWDEIAEVEAAAAAMPTGRPRRNSSALLGSDYDDSEEEEAELGGETGGETHVLSGHLPRASDAWRPPSADRICAPKLLLADARVCAARAPFRQARWRHM